MKGLQLAKLVTPSSRQKGLPGIRLKPDRTETSDPIGLEFALFENPALDRDPFS